MSRVRNSENAPIAAFATRGSGFSVACAASAAADFSGSVATSVVAMPITTSAAMTT